MNKSLSEIIIAIPDAHLDLRYESSNNVLGRPLYSNPKALLHKDALNALAKAAQELRKQGLQIVVWDAYRPVKVQNKLREFCSDNRYVSEVSNHNRGITVDLTLSKQGTLLDMGTDFDTFSEKAHANSSSITDYQRANRSILSRAMADAGFTQLSYEWWHYDFIGWKNYEVLDIDFEELEK